MTVKTVIFVLLFTETSFIYPIFVHVLFRVLYPEKRMKRESGESPEQSRCCEFRKRCINTYATVLEEWEGDTSGISQKTCKTKSKNCPFEESGQCVSGFKIIFAYFVWREELKYG